MASAQEHLQKLFTKAATSLQSGNVQEAKKGFIQLSRKIPESAVVWYNLGLCYQHLQQHDRAIEAFEKVLKLDRNQADAWVNLGISEKHLGRLDSARSAAGNALKAQPNHPRALNLAGSIDAENQETDSARSLLEKSLVIDPDNVDAVCNLANLEIESRNADRAEELVAPMLEKHPDSRELRLLQSKLLMGRKEFNDASPIVLALEQEFPDDEEVMRLNLSFREGIRDHFGAITISEKLLKQVPEDAGVWNSLGGAYFQLDSINKSRDCYEKAVALDPEHAEYENNLGLVHSSLGDKDNAEKHYRRSLELNPMHAEAYRNLAAMKKFKSMEDPDAQDVLEIWGQDDLDDFLRIKTAFALGKIYDDCGLHEQAFEVYKVGNDLKFQESRINLETYFNHIDSVSRVLDVPPSQVNTRSMSPLPIFVLGMPRSGTTLIEQVLSRHSQVSGYGELPCIERAISRIEKRSEPMKSYPGDFWSVNADRFHSEAEEYLRWVRRLHDVDTPYFTDKMPFNFVHVWLIKAMFPEAPIINCRRHPLDVITSNYFQLYGSDISFVYNLEALSDYYIRYHQLMEHWNRVFEGQIYNVVYERFVAESEDETRKLVAAAGLEWEDGCLDQKSANTAVRTASIWQVRQGIYTSSRERWRKYESQFSKVIEKLSEHKILDSEGNWIAQ